ncbi:MAG TPA: CHAT domain-containing protein [Saprospiraceae bacterium]|nr:CHAT domain-containing protein [Saprospiraceae bacterium]HNT19004.1 CHAT domain-containing protein [Saprospiraceae bacterium]
MEIASADSLFYGHLLEKAIERYDDLISKSSESLKNYLYFRRNEAAQRLNAHMVLTTELFDHTPIQLSEFSTTKDLLLYFMDEINLYNEIEFGVFTTLCDSILLNEKVPDYWRAKMDLLRGEYTFYVLNDLYGSYAYYIKANSKFDSLPFITHETVYTKKELILLTIGQRQYLFGGQLGEEMKDLSIYFTKDTILQSYAFYNSGYIRAIVDRDSGYIKDYNEALLMVKGTKYIKLYQQVLYSFSYSCINRGNERLAELLNNDLMKIVASSDTFVNVDKISAEAFYSNGKYLNTINHSQKAILYLFSLKRFPPSVYLTLSTLLIESYRRIGQLSESTAEAFNNINYKSPIKAFTVEDILMGMADYGYFNFIIVGDIIKNLFLEFKLSGNENKLNMAIRLLDKAEDMINKENYSIEETRRLEVLSYSKSIYEMAMEIYFVMWKSNENVWAFEKFYRCMEKVKASILSGEMNDVKLKLMIPEDVVRKEEFLKNEIRACRMGKKKEAKLDELYFQYDEFNKYLKMNFIEYFNAKTVGEVKSLKEVAIPDTVLFLSIYLIDSNLYILNISTVNQIFKEKVDYRFLQTLDSLIEYQRLGKYDHLEYIRMSNIVYKVILGKLNLDDKKSIVFCPSGKFYNLNFNLLLFPDGKDYLKEHYNLFYTFSASTMKQEGMIQRNDLKTAAFSFSDPNTIRNPTSSFVELPGGYHEILQFKKKANNISYSGLKSTRARFIDCLTNGKYNHLYIAHHGVVISNERENVYLIFRTNTFSEFDTLFGYDLLKYRSKTFQITLAGCETGIGDIIDYEGTYNMVRYFKIIGARRIIASLKKINDVKNEFEFVVFI